MPFAGMVGRALAKQLLKKEAKAAAKKAAANAYKGMGNAYKGAFHSSGKYLFVAHPNCCPKCNLLGMTPHFFNTPDVAFITHPNCMCATIEAPDGLSPEELMAWAKNPTGNLRFGFNYGKSFKPVNVTDANRAKAYELWQGRMNPATRGNRLKRARVGQKQIDKIRELVEMGALGKAKDLTKRIQGISKAAKTRAQKKLFKEAAIKAQKKAAEIKIKNRDKSSKIKFQKALMRKNEKVWDPNQLRKQNSTLKARKNFSKTTYRPLKYAGISTEFPRNRHGNTTVKPRNKSISSLAVIVRKKVNDQIRKKREREQWLKKYGLI